VRLIVLLITFALYSAFLFYVGSKSDKTNNAHDSLQKEESIGGIERPAPQENILSARVLASNVKLCANTKISFEVAYPNDWFTTYNNKEDECFFFAPYTFVVPSIPENYFTPITIKKIPEEEWESTVSSFENPSDLYSVISFKNLEINNKPTKLIEAISTGSSQPKGYYKITYLVFDTNKSLEMTYLQQTQDEDTKSYRQVLDDIVNSLRYF